MAPAMSKLADLGNNQRGVFTALSTASLLYWLHSSFKINPSQKLVDEVKFVVGSRDEMADKKIQINGEFLRDMKGIMKILVPRAFCKETGYLLLVALTLVVRSLCDIWMINNGTLIEGAIISGEPLVFKKYLVDFFFAMPMISLINNTLKFSLSSLRLSFRQRLSNHLYDNYLKNFTYYKMNNLDNRMSNADQLLTQDVDKFCESVVDLYSNISKPILDIFIYVQKLTTTLGPQIPCVMVMYLIVSGTVLTSLRKKTSRFTAQEQKLEGELRFVNSRLITNSEEIAFYNGNVREKRTINSAFNRLIEHIKHFNNFRFTMGFVDNIIAKYFATCVGFCVVALPYFTSSGLANSEYRHKMQFYYKSGRMMVKLAEAIGRLVLAGRELTKLAGYTARVQQLLTVLKDINSGNYTRTMMSSTEPNEEVVPVGHESSLLSSRGTVLEVDNLIKFEKVPLVTPNGDVLVKELTFQVNSGINVLVCGPNGCGKSSLFRILGELWPVFGGTVTKPAKGKLFYIPQRPYMTLGTLRDQLIYPDSSSRLTDAVLWELLDRVQLTHIVDREGGWDSVADWMDVLSGGEKQRIAMARVFYHCPQFAILDECTSAVSVDVEDAMYRHCRQLGITLFTVSHRKSLWKHHQYYLHMDGRGAFDFKPIEEDTKEFGS